MRQAAGQAGRTRRAGGEIEGVILIVRTWQRALVLLAALVFIARPSHATIDYAISLSHPENHIFDVTMHVPGVRDEVILQMPAWNATYQIRDFSSRMMQVSARDDAGKPLPILK